LPSNYATLMILGQAMWAWFVFAFGACVGSLINVLVYRMPLGLSVLTPPSRCPSCETRLTWRENIPIFGWLMLGGRCRFCRSKISPEYPLVELATALLFLGVFSLWYFMPPDAVWLGVHWGQLRPHWTLGDLHEGWPRNSWPIFLVMLALLGSLTAMTIVDAKTFTIPLPIPWFAAVVGLTFHPLYALYYQLSAHKPRLGAIIAGTEPVMGPGGIGTIQTWVFPTPQNWPVIIGVFAGVAGLGIGMLLLHFGLIRRSFADYEQWEKDATEAAARDAAARGDPAPAPPANGESDAPGGPEMWIQYPHARREMIKELAFLAPCVSLGLGGWMLAQNMGVSGVPPLWVQVLAAVLLGYLVGGGVVWLVRICGSLGFGREAMGLGDVHLMAAVGACLGWRDAVLAFFGAAFVGLAWELVSRIVMKSRSRAMPYGPHLAVSTVLVLLLNPWVMALMERLGLADVLG